MPTRVPAILAIACLPTFLAACGGSPTRRDSGTVRQLVQEVEAVTVSLTGGCPPEVRVEVLVGIGGCHTLRSPVVTRSGETITARIEVDSAGEVCNAALYGETVRFSLGHDLPPADYRLLIPSRSGRVGDETFAVPACTG